MLARVRRKSETDQPEMKYWRFIFTAGCPSCRQPQLFRLWASGDQVYTFSNLQQRSPNCLRGCLLIYRPRKDGRLSGPVAEPGVEPGSSTMRGSDANHCATATTYWCQTNKHEMIHDFASQWTTLCIHLDQKQSFSKPLHTANHKP